MLTESQLHFVSNFEKTMLKLHPHKGIKLSNLIFQSLQAKIDHSQMLCIVLKVGSLTCHTSNGMSHQ